MSAHDFETLLNYNTNMIIVLLFAGGVKDRGGNQSEAAPQRGRLGSNRKFKGKGILGPQAILKNGHRSSVDSV